MTIFNHGAQRHGENLCVKNLLALGLVESQLCAKQRAKMGHSAKAFNLQSL